MNSGRFCLLSLCAAMAAGAAARADSVYVVGSSQDHNIAATEANTYQNQLNTLRSAIANESARFNTALTNNNAFQSALQRLSQINQKLYELRRFANPGQILSEAFGGLVPAELMQMVNEVKQLKSNAEGLMDAMEGLTKFDFDFDQLLSASGGGGRPASAGGSSCGSSSTCAGSRCDLAGNVSKAYAAACASGCTADAATGAVVDYDMATINASIAKVDAQIEAIDAELSRQIMWLLQTDQEFYEKINQQMEALMADMTKDRPCGAYVDKAGAVSLLNPAAPTGSGIVSVAQTANLNAGAVTPDQAPVTQSEVSQWQARMEQMKLSITERQRLLENLRVTQEQLDRAREAAKRKVTQFCVQNGFGIGLPVRGDNSW